MSHGWLEVGMKPDVPSGNKKSQSPLMVVSYRATPMVSFFHGKSQQKLEDDDWGFLVLAQVAGL